EGRQDVQIPAVPSRRATPRYGFAASFASLPVLVSAWWVEEPAFFRPCFSLAPVDLPAWLTLRATLFKPPGWWVESGVVDVTPVASFDVSLSSLPFALSARCAPLEA